jgi:hypothetical protein
MSRVCRYEGLKIRLAASEKIVELQIFALRLRPASGLCERLEDYMSMYKNSDI